MSRINLQEKFPLMTPVKSAPTLTRINGCGVALYGARDRDAETGAYVANWCICVLFIPLFCLRAYRVAKAPTGWYFLGREPLSGLAKAWNLILLLAVGGLVGGIQYSIYTSSPAYKAQARMTAADKLVKEGRLAKAAAVYEDLAIGLADESVNASQAINKLMDEQCAEAPLAESAGVYECAAQVARRGQNVSASDVASKGLKLAVDKGDADPKSGLKLLDAVRPLVSDTRKIDARRLGLLRKLAGMEPSNLEVIVPLASILEADNQIDEAKKLLMPIKDKLGDGEGARVLGSILAREGDHNGAYALLWPYVKTRLDRLHAAERSSDDTIKQIWKREVDLLDKDKGPRDFYEKYNNAGTQEQNAIVQQYVGGKVKNDPQFRSTQDALEREAAVVPVALELGIVMLGRAQGQTDTTERRKQLEAAEQVFLAVGGVAGQSDEYRLSLGQVYYWLGRQAEGKKLFDEFLTSKGRNFMSLLQMAYRLRQLGANPEARAMAEEAYAKASKPAEQHEAAAVRAPLFTDQDDQIAWLQKGDTSSLTIKAELGLAMGEKAFAEGRDDEAARQFNVAVDTYAQMPRSSSTLNQTALACFDIFEVTGDHKTLERSLDYFQQAVDLDPTNTILLYNAGVTILQGAVSDLIGNEIDLRALHRMGGLSMLGYLYRDQAGQEALAKRVKEHPGIGKALSYLDKVTILSPKNGHAYSALYAVHAFTRNEAALRTLEQRLQASGLDNSDDLAKVKEHLSGSKDQQNQVTGAAALKRVVQQADSVRAKGGATAAVAICNQAQAMMAMDLINSPTDMQAVVALAEEANRISPSASTKGVVYNAYLHRAMKDLRRSDLAFDAFCKKNERSASVSTLMIIALSEPGPFQKLAMQNADVRKAMEIIREEGVMFPEHDSAQNWAMMKNVDAGEAERFAEGVRKSKLRLLEQSISTLLAPASVNEAVETYWTMQILGKVAEGKAALKKVAGMGVPVPIEP